MRMGGRGDEDVEEMGDVDGGKGVMRMGERG